MKSSYSYLREAYQQKAPAEWQSILAAWRKSNTIVRVQRPFRLDRARALGFKAKTGFALIRVRVMRGGRKKPKRRAGRRSARMGRKLTLGMNYQSVAEARVQRKFPNMEIINSYSLAKDGQYAWFEVIMIDPSRPEIQADKNLNWACSNKNRKRALRGLTSSGRKSRALR
jgi:large subunit ribosomal protein L15e